jgi:predicted Zn-dependent peptidase
MSSRLFQEIREKRGLCYSIYAFANSFIDGGLVGIYAGTGEREAADISALVAGEMEALAVNAGDQEVARAKAQLKSGLLMGLERPTSRAEQIAAHLLAYGRVLSVEEITAKLEEVDKHKVRHFGERLLRSRRPAVAAIGPVSRLERYEVFARRFGSGAISSQAAE